MMQRRREWWRVRLRALWLETRERAFDLLVVSLPVFIMAGVIVLSIRFWLWVVGVDLP